MTSLRITLLARQIPAAFYLCETNGELPLSRILTLLNAFLCGLTLTYWAPIYLPLNDAFKVTIATINISCFYHMSASLGYLTWIISLNCQNRLTSIRCGPIWFPPDRRGKWSPGGWLTQNPTAVGTLTCAGNRSAPSSGLGVTPTFKLSPGTSRFWSVRSNPESEGPKVTAEMIQTAISVPFPCHPFYLILLILRPIYLFCKSSGIF